MTKPIFLPRLSDHAVPNRSLLFQCPICKELTTLQVFQTSDQGLAIQCQECAEVFFYPTQEAKEEVSTASTVAAKTVEEEHPGASSRRLASKASLLAQSKDSPLDNPVLAKDEAVSAKKQPSTVIAKEPKSREGMKQCPKCSSWCDDSLSSCPSCGLLFANVGKTYVPSTEDAPSSTEEKGAWQLWSTVEDEWGDELTHEAFVKYCVSNELYDFVSLRYRQIKDLEDERSPKAEEQLGKIVDLVQQQFLLRQQSDTTMEDKVGRWKKAMAVFLLLLGFLAFYLIWRQMFAPSPVVIP